MVFALTGVLVLIGGVGGALLLLFLAYKLAQINALAEMFAPPNSED